MARNTILIFLIRFCLLAITLFGYIFYSRELSIDEYGVYAKTILVCLPIFLAIGSFGIVGIVYNFNGEGLKHVIQHSSPKEKLIFLSYTAIIGICYGIISAWISNSLHWDFFITASVFLCLQVWNYCIDNIAIVFHQYKQQLWINIGYMILVIYAHYYTILSNSFSLYSLISLWAIILFIKLGVQIFFLKNKIFNKETSLTLVQIPKRKTWIDLGINDILQIVLRQIDKIIITAFSSASAAAIYFNGRMEIPLLPTVLSSVKSAALLQLVQRNHDQQSLIKIVHWSFKIMSALTIGIMMWGLFFKHELISNVLGDKYLASIPYLIVTLLMLPSQYCIAITYILQYKERAHIINRSVILELIVSIILMIPCYTIWGALGIAISVLISSYLIAFYLLFMSSKVVKVSLLQLLPLRFYGITFILNGVIAWGAHSLLSNQFNSLTTLIVGSILGLMLLIIQIKFFIPSYNK